MITVANLHRMANVPLDQVSSASFQQKLKYGGAQVKTGFLQKDSAVDCMVKVDCVFV